MAFVFILPNLEGGHAAVTSGMLKEYCFFVPEPVPYPLQHPVVILLLLVLSLSCILYAITSTIPVQ